MVFGNDFKKGIMSLTIFFLLAYILNYYWSLAEDHHGLGILFNQGALFAKLTDVENVNGGAKVSHQAGG